MGCQNALQLWREVNEKGYKGSPTTVRDFVVPLRKPGMTPAIKRAERFVPATKVLSWLQVLPEHRTAEQTALVATLYAACPTLITCRDLAVSFQDILRRRLKDELAGWLDRAKASDLPAFVTFVRGIRADYAAVKAAFSLEWSNTVTLA